MLKCISLGVVVLVTALLPHYSRLSKDVPSLLMILERGLTKSLGSDMLPSCHGSQVLGNGKTKGVNQNWLPWQPRNISKPFQLPV
jgi:hypothetical protein